ncbi:bacterio-opsin activator domain-containing protein [Natrialbaceae archaeon A-arb3/5]
MTMRNELAEATLETLPFTVAVLNEAGEILLTNQSWREFGPDEEREHVGVNYIATATTEDDEHAERAVAGLESLLAGEREMFSMEYPCHTPDEKQWFLMRAVRFTVDGDVRISVVHLDITERKLAEIAAEESAERLAAERQTLEHVLDRVDGLVRNVTDAAVSAGTREEIERSVCTPLVEADPYVLAWIGRVDVTSRRITLQEWASRDDVPLEDDDLRLDTDDTHPAVDAVETGEPQVVQDVESFDEAARWWPHGACESFRSVAALPLAYGDVTYGVLVVFADQPDVFEKREVLVLDSLAGTIATAMNAIEMRRMLTTETVVELELAIEDSSLFVTSLATDLEATVTYRGLASDADGTPLAYLHVDRTGNEADTEADLEGVSDVTVLSEHEGGTLLELPLTNGIVTAIADHGAVIQQFETDSSVADLVLNLPNSKSARSVYDLLEERLDRVELISYHETERPTRTPQDIAAEIESNLTDRQLLALRKAYFADYFEWPRAVSGEELADSMGISRSTFHEHLRAAQQKLLNELFTHDPTSEG